MVTNYISINEEYEDEIVEKKSKFISHVFPIKNEEEALKLISDINKKYKDASHNVYAYRLIDKIERYSDDGEPSGTGGMAILEILRKNNLENILVMVTRYFGGTLLGTGGLKRAYSEVTKKSINRANMIKFNLCKEYKLDIEYKYYDMIQHYCKKNKFFITRTEFLDNIFIYIRVKIQEEKRFLREIEDLLDCKVEENVVNTYYYP